MSSHIPKIKTIYKTGDYTNQSFIVSKDDKYKYGEIYTPYSSHQTNV